MIKTLRQPTLQTLGLGTVLEIFERGQLPANSGELIETIFGKPDSRGALIISGVNGIVGAGKALQLGSRLEPFGVPIVGLDFPNTPDSLGTKYPALVKAFGVQRAERIMSNIVHLSYDGKQLPAQLNKCRPCFLLEAIPEILALKKAHYEFFRKTFPDIEIRSVTSGFPSTELGVGIAHPAFPHEINKVWEMVEPQPSAITQLFWSLGMIPVPVSDHWSFVLDVLFCGLTLSALRYCRKSNMPFWKIDKYIRKYFGANPFRAHDVIGAKGANFLTWSCLHHLGKKYGPLFEPTADLSERKDSGQNWYPLNHLRPIVNWNLADEQEFIIWLQGSLFQMVSIMLKEKRSHLSHINAIGELCAQFRNGILATVRQTGHYSVIDQVTAFHKLFPPATDSEWYPSVFEKMDSPEWQQLYVNAEHNGSIGVITISRESYNQDVDDELNRAIDWLVKEGIHKVIITGDFHLSTQMVGADTSEFFPALNNTEDGYRISKNWSRTARRLHDDFKISVGYINGKRCLGGFLELLLHCHYLVADNAAKIGFPEITLPVVPGMEGCHWPFRKTEKQHWPQIMELLLTGKQVVAQDTVGGLLDYTGSTVGVLAKIWQIVNEKDHAIPCRTVNPGKLTIDPNLISLQASDNPLTETARLAIVNTVKESCRASLTDALTIQAKHSAGFLNSETCKKGIVGKEFQKNNVN